MTKNLDRYERVARFLFGLVLLLSAWQFLEHPVARVMMTIGGLYCLWEAASGHCPLHARFGATSPNDRLPPAARALFTLSALQMLFAYAWWGAGWEKLSNPAFVPGMAKTLGYFMSQNPFPWYQSFLKTVAIPHAGAFGTVVAWGEALIGVGLAVAIGTRIWLKGDAARRKAMWLSVAALSGAALMNAAFYLAAGWTGPAAQGENAVMFWTEIALIYAWLTEAI